MTTPPSPPPPPGGGYGAGQGYGYGYGARPGMNPQQERTWASMAHWGSIVAAFVALAFLAPLIVLLVKGNESAFVRRHAVESLNFQISAMIYLVVSAILILALVGFFLLAGLAVLWIVTVIIGSVRAGSGEEYRYPLAIRFVK